MTPPRSLVTGASGLLGGYLLEEVARHGWPVSAWAHNSTGRLSGVDLERVDVTDSGQVRNAFAAARPEVVIHAAALASVNSCYLDPMRAAKVNVHATEELAQLAERAGARLIFVSTDLVFDGKRGNYAEGDVAAPLSVYGRTKLLAEQAVQKCRRHAVVRVSLLFGPTRTGRLSFFDQQLSALHERRPIALFHDEWRTPLSLQTAAQALVAIADADVTGLLHLGGPERMSRMEMGQRLAVFLGLDAGVIAPVARVTAGAEEPRPADTSLDSSRWRQQFPDHPWPPFEEAVQNMLSTMPRCNWNR